MKRRIILLVGQTPGLRGSPWTPLCRIAEGCHES
jgi:hypothetical protein